MQKYHILSRLIHWFMAILIIFLLGLGIYMTGLDKENANRMSYYGLHKSLGVVALVFIFIRILNRLINKPPAFPETIKKSERALAHAVHYALYVLMVVVPFSGYLMSNSFGFPVHFFSIKMPNLVEANSFGKVFAQIHEIAAYTVLGIVFLHVLGALKHAMFDAKENNVFRRMI